MLQLVIFSYLVLAVPGPVAGLMVVDLNSTAIRVSWSPPTITNGIITQYNVTISQSGIPPEIVTNTNLSSYTLTFSGLTAFTEYTVTVTATTRIREGVAETRAVMTDPFAASAPSPVSAEPVNSTSVIVGWSYPVSPRGEIIGYQIEVINDSSPMMMMMVVNTLNVTLTMLNDVSNQALLVNGLRPYTFYFFSVRAFSFGMDPFVIHLGEAGEARQRTNEAG